MVFSTWVLQYVLMTIGASIISCWLHCLCTCVTLLPHGHLEAFNCLFSWSRNIYFSHLFSLSAYFPCVSFTACLFMQLYFHCGENEYLTSGMFYYPSSQPQAWCRWREQHTESCECGGGRQILICKQIRVSLRFPLCQGSFPVSMLPCYYCGGRHTCHTHAHTHSFAS